MDSSGQHCPNLVEARLIFKWTGLLMGNKNRARIGPNAGHVLGCVYGPQSSRPSNPAIPRFSLDPHALNVSLFSLSLSLSLNSEPTALRSPVCPEPQHHRHRRPPLIRVQSP